MFGAGGKFKGVYIWLDCVTLSLSYCDFSPLVIGVRG